jgi:hypothetical protein
MPKTMSLRFSDNQAKALELVARVDEQPLAAVVRDALDEHIQARVKSPEFQVRLKQQRAEESTTYDKLVQDGEW